MAVTVTSIRNHVNMTSSTLRVIGTLTLSGTYATGGFTANLNPAGMPGTSPAPTRSFTALAAQDFYSPLGYSYRVVSGTPAAAVIKIFNGVTELTNGAAVPDASLTYRAEFQKFS